MKASDFRPGQVVLYRRGPRVSSTTYTGTILGASEHDCRECPTYLHVRPTAARHGDGPITKPALDVHHVDPETVRSVDGRAVER